MYTILVLSGDDSKSVGLLMNNLKEIPGLAVLKLSTTRPRAAGEEDVYDFRAEGNWQQEKLLWTVDAGSYLYGMRKTELGQLRDGIIGVTLLDSDAIGVFAGCRKSSHIEYVVAKVVLVGGVSGSGGIQGGSRSMAPEGGASASDTRPQSDLDIIISGQATDLHDAIIQIAILLLKRGVLHRDAISALMKAGALIKNGDIRNVQPASYDLRLGDTIWCKGKLETLTEDKPVAVVPPYSYIIAESIEQAYLPKFITAHYDIKLSLFIKGITLSNGPQVDPGYSGGLFCLLFNSSDTNVGINRGDHFATIEFCTTSRVTEGYQGEHQMRFRLRDFMEGTTAVSSGGTLFDQLHNLTSAWTRWKSGIIVVGLSVLFGLSVIFMAATDRLADVRDAVRDARRQQEEVSRLIQMTQEQNRILQSLLDKSENQTSIKEALSKNQEALKSIQRK